MKALLLLLALTLPAIAQTSDIGVTSVDYDRFKDITTVRLTESLMPDRPGYVLLTVLGTLKGKEIKGPPDHVALIITSVTPDWYFLRSQNILRVIQDEERYTLGEMKRDNSEVLRGQVLEQLVLEVPFSAIKKLAKAKKIEIQVGPYESEINPSAIDNLKEWLSRFPIPRSSP